MAVKPFPKKHVLKKPLRVHIACATPAGYRWMRQNGTGGDPPVATLSSDRADQVFTVFRPDRFHAMLDAAECKIIETLAGSKKRRKR